MGVQSFFSHHHTLTISGAILHFPRFVQWVAVPAGERRFGGILNDYEKEDKKTVGGLGEESED